MRIREGNNWQFYTFGRDSSPQGPSTPNILAECSKQQSLNHPLILSCFCNQSCWQLRQKSNHSVTIIYSLPEGGALVCLLLCYKKVLNHWLQLAKILCSHHVSKALTAFFFKLYLQKCPYSQQPQKSRVVSHSGARGRGAKSPSEKIHYVRRTLKLRVLVL